MDGCNCNYYIKSFRQQAQKEGQSKWQPLLGNGSEGGANRPASSPRLFWLNLAFFSAWIANVCTVFASKPECVRDTWRQARGPAEVEGA